MARPDTDRLFPPERAVALLDRLAARDPVDGPESVVETPLGLAALASGVLAEQRRLREQLAAAGARLDHPGDGGGDPATRAVVDEVRRHRPHHERYLALAVTAFDLADLCDAPTGRAYGSRLPALARDAALCRLERIARRLWSVSARRVAARLAPVAAP